MQRPMTAFFRIACLLALIAAPLFAPAIAQAAEHLSLSADSVRFYGDRFLLEADGNVSIVLDHKYQLSGHTFSMDLRLNRFVIAGDVHLRGPDVNLNGAGFADFFDSQRVYFIPLLDQPDRWTFEANDFSHPFKGRQMPGDPFFLPDISNARITVRSDHAEIEPLTYVRFSHAQVLSAGVMLPLPSYVINFSNNPDFRQNSLAGAIMDAPYDFFGNTHLLSTVHLRYDQTNNAYISYEQHYTARGGYLVASLNPITKPIKQYNVIGLGRIGHKDQAYGFFQAITYQPGLFSSPAQLSAFGNIQLTHVLRQSYLQLSLNQNYDTLLSQPSTFDPAHGYYNLDFSHVWIPMHPFYGVLTWQGFDHPIRHSPLTFRLRSAFIWAHDNTYAGYSPGLTTLDGQVFNSISNQTLDALIYSKPIKLHENTYVNFSFEKSRQWFSLPHYIDSTVSNMSLSKTYGSKIAAYLGYTINNIGDYYGKRQSQIYPPVASYVSPVTGQSYTGFAAFRGFATYRTLYGSLVLAPTPDFTLNLLLRHNADFPEPIPGVLGNPPNQLTGDVRFRISPHATADISRTFNFNYPGQAWSPTFTIQVLP